MKYSEFLKNKIALSQNNGFKINQNEINPMLKPHQKDIVEWALHGGRRAIFAAFGLGKSFMQLECLRIINKKEKGKQLIIAPLGVRQEFKIDSKKLNIKIRFIRKTEELKEDGLYITNYESVRDGKLNINKFNACSLDEASVLRSYGSKTFQTFLTLFQSVKYRFVATATPSPNRYKELIHYGGFLGVMDTGAALTRFFKRDSQKAGNLQIHPHKEKEFWLWLSTWAIFLQKPSDIGYPDTGYDLPKLNIHYHQVAAGDIERIDKKDGQILAFGDSSLSLQAASHEKKSSLPQRISKMMEIIKNDPSHYIIWHDQEIERHAIKKALPIVNEVFGSQNLDIREQKIIDFSNGKYQYLATKPILSGSGCNFQRYCNKAVFLGIGFKFNDFIQAIHRIYRFLQTKECEIHIIYAESEISILKILKDKWVRHDVMVDKMTKLIKQYGLSLTGKESELTRSMGIKRQEVAGKNFIVANNDCVQECKRMADNSIDLIHTSIPFANHYEYTPSYNDFGHTEGNNHFWEQMDYLTPDLLRVLKPGRIYACHVKDRILFGNVTGKGMPTVSPFHAECLFHSMQHGFDYMGMITVVTDVVRENNQTYRLGWTEQCKDGSKMGVGSPEYILLFRKPQTDRTRGYADDPINKTKEEYTRAKWQIDAHSFWRSSGDRLLNPEELNAGDFVKEFKKDDLNSLYNYKNHVEIGEKVDIKGKLPATFMSIAPNSKHYDVWSDINRMNTLNSSQKRRNQNMHICPLQIDIVERIITRYTNKNDVVFDPFAGIMTVPYIALKLGRKAQASELNPDYFKDGVKYLQKIEREGNILTLFDTLKEVNYD